MAIEPFNISTTSLIAETDLIDTFSPLRALLSGFSRSTKEAGRAKWMNSPNVYQKVEVLETGTTEPKKITKVVLSAFKINIITIAITLFYGTWHFLLNLSLLIEAV